MNEAASKLLKVRKRVVISKLGDYIAVRQELLNYFKICLESDHGKLIDENKEPDPETFSTKVVQVTGISIALLSIVAFVVLAIFQFAFEQSVPEALTGTGVIAFLSSALRVLGGKEGITNVIFGVGSFDRLASTTRPRLTSQ